MGTEKTKDRRPEFRKGMQEDELLDGGGGRAGVVVVIVIAFLTGRGSGGLPSRSTQVFQAGPTWP